MPELIVQLRYATLPGLLRLIAIHYWFAVFEPVTGRWTRWEVWQDANAGGVACGHVHRDLMPVDDGVGGGPARIAATWRGDEAQHLAAALSQSASYPARDRYRAWPGPNSNTFARWILDRCRLRCPLDGRAIGKDFRGWVGLRVIPGETAIAVDQALVGLQLSTHGIEGHLLGFTLGVSWLPLTIRTPFGDLPDASTPVGR